MRAVMMKPAWALSEPDRRRLCGLLPRGAGGEAALARIEVLIGEVMTEGGPAPAKSRRAYSKVAKAVARLQRDLAALAPDPLFPEPISDGGALDELRDQLRQRLPAYEFIVSRKHPRRDRLWFGIFHAWESAGSSLDPPHDELIALVQEVSRITFGKPRKPRYIENLLRYYLELPRFVPASLTPAPPEIGAPAVGQVHDLRAQDFASDSPGIGRPEL
jgi:hypothetical protein